MAHALVHDKSPMDGPEPLRSDEFPMGLPSLTDDQRRRVELANEMYTESCKIFSYCVSKGMLATMENPSNSLFWSTTPAQQLRQEVDIHYSEVQMWYDGWTASKMDSTGSFICSNR